MNSDARHPVPLARGGYVARMAVGREDIRAAQAMRHVSFVDAAGRAAMADGLDQDAYDALCDHVLIEDTNGRLVGCYRVQFFTAPEDLSNSYSAQYYNLDGLSDLRGGFLELGRFCVTSDAADSDVLRIAWGMLARLVDLYGAAILFGCSSFSGTDPSRYGAAFDLLGAKHASPRISTLADETIGFQTSQKNPPDRAVALGQIPPLLRTYLSMGGWVSDHAVVDREMNTLHVFTGLEIAAIPPARAKALRAIANG